MKYISKIILPIVFLTLSSCSQSLEKELIINDFTRDHEVFFLIEEQRSMSTNINLEISGNISDTIFFNSIGSDLTRYPIAPEELPIKRMADYYGSPGKIGYRFYAAPDVKGELKIRLVMP